MVRVTRTAARRSSLIVVPSAADLARLPRLQLQRAALDADELLQLVTRADDGLAKVEQQLVEALNDELSGRVPGALDAALGALASSGDFTEADLTRCLSAAEKVITDGWAGAVEGAVGDGIGDAYSIGRAKTLKPLGQKVDWNAVDEHAQELLQQDSMYWIGDAWDNQLGDDIAGVIRREVIEKGLSRKEAGAALGQIFGEQFPERASSYWDIVASAGVVRSRSFGAVESFVQADAVEYRILVIEDSRTCQVCQHLDGKVFHVDAAVEQRDAFLAAEDPEAAKEAHPWVTEDDVAGKSAEELQAAGIMLPPYHGRCRCHPVVHRFKGE